MFNEVAAAKRLMEMDAIIREEAEENDIDTWLTLGVPDGTKSWQELVPLKEEEYEEMEKVGRRIIIRIMIEDVYNKNKKKGW